MQHAVDEEDYDEAAKLSEELDLLKERVSQVIYVPDTRKTY